MKNKYLIFCVTAVVLNLNNPAFAFGGTTDDGITWSLEGNTLVLRPTVEGSIVTMKDYSYKRNPSGVSSPYNISDAPWGRYYNSIKTIDVAEGITNFGAYACYCCKQLTKINFPDSMSTIGDSAFTYTDNLTQIELGKNITDIGDRAFNSNASTKTFILNDKLQNIDYFGLENPTKVYCNDTPQGRCRALLVANQGNNGTLVLYEQDEYGLYSTTENGSTKYYTSSQNMLNSTSCNGDLLTCRATALKSEGNLCSTTDECKELISALEQGNIFTIGNKQYASLEDYKNGIEYIKPKKRIYTVEEANEVAGPVNRVSITYK